MHARKVLRCVVRSMWQEIFNGRHVKHKHGVRKDKFVLPQACLDAAFSTDKKTAAKATGLSELTASRCMLVVANELAERCALASAASFRGVV